MNYKIVPMKVMGDERGKLVALEENKIYLLRLRGMPWASIKYENWGKHKDKLMKN